MNVVFCGTPEFAVPTLNAVIAGNFNIALVITNPDGPRGRGYQPAPPPVKVAAAEAGLAVFQPARLKDAGVQETISAARPDVVIVVAYGHLIPPWMIALPPLGCINLHASLLPRYRGAAPIAWAIVRGERVTGVTTMQIDAGLDTGPILLQREMEIREDDTAGTLGARLSHSGARLMVETLEGLKNGRIRARAQDNSLATLAPLLKKADGRIAWNLEAGDIAHRVRGLQPWPVAYTAFRSRTLRVWQAQPAGLHDAAALAPGEIVVGKDRLTAGCGAGTQLDLIEVQIEGRKRMEARDFINGMRARSGEMLG